MPSEIPLRSETMTQIIRLARFAILCTLALAAVLLIVDFLRGPGQVPHFLTGTVVQAVVYAIAAQVIVAIAAATCMALWK